MGVVTLSQRQTLLQRKVCTLAKYCVLWRRVHVLVGICGALESICGALNGICGARGYLWRPRASRVPRAAPEIPARALPPSPPSTPLHTPNGAWCATAAARKPSLSGALRTLVVVRASGQRGKPLLIAFPIGPPCTVFPMRVKAEGYAYSASRL